MHSFVVLPFISTFVLYTAGYKLFFVNIGDKQPGQFVVQVVFPSLSIYNVYTLVSAPTPPSLLVILSMVILMTSLILFGWAAYSTRRTNLSVVFTTDTPVSIIQEGPYRFIRHPFYAAYILVFVAAWSLHQHTTGLLCVLMIASIYTYAARMEELKFTKSTLSEAYAKYQEGTGMFWPSGSRVFSVLK